MIDLDKLEAAAKAARDARNYTAWNAVVQPVTVLEMVDEIKKHTGRMCVNCGRWFPESYYQTHQPSDCKSPDACAIDMTVMEALEAALARAKEAHEVTAADHHTWIKMHADRSAELSRLLEEHARLKEALVNARDTILALKNQRGSEALGSDDEWIADIAAALESRT